MKPENHIMIDLETAGTRPGSAILTIGAIRFDPDLDDLGDDPRLLPPSRTFYRRIERGSGRSIGLTEHPDTLEWWRRQSPASRQEAFDAVPRHPIAEVMSDFSDWCGQNPLPWSHGASFDVVLCETVFDRLGRRPPWNFWDIRDTRTLYAFTGQKPARDGSHHHALHDACAQAAAVQRAYAYRHAPRDARPQAAAVSAGKI